MSEPFDAYYKWLAIPPSEQPPNHYRLLGLPLYESDKDVIAAAAVQRMNFVRKFQKGATIAAARKLSQEIANAWACLINPQKKQEYDEHLQLHLAASHDSLLQSSPVPELPPVAGVAVVTDLTPEAPTAIGAPELDPGNQVVQTPEPPDQGANEPSAFDFDASAASHPQFSEAEFVEAASTGGSDRKSRRKRHSFNPIMHVVASFTGLALGYLILCSFGPQYDFLNLMHKAAPKSDVSATKTANTKSEQP